MIFFVWLPAPELRLGSVEMQESSSLWIGDSQLLELGFIANTVHYSSLFSFLLGKNDGQPSLNGL